ncbi:MAG: acyl carrier protein [Bacteroidales bacterium]
MEQKLIDVFREALEIDATRSITLDDSIQSFPEWSSLTQLSLIAALDEEFGVIIEMRVLEKLETLADLLNEIKKRRS